MKRLHVVAWLVLLPLLAAGPLSTHTSTAAPQSGAAPRALAIAVSESAHHVFALSGYGGAGASWVTMLHATSHKVLRSVRVANDGQQIFVDEPAGRVLVVSGAVPGMVAANTRITALDVKTGKAIKTLSLMKGVVRWTQDASELGRLYVIVGTAVAGQEFGAGSVLYAINCRTLKLTHTLALQTGDQAAVVQALSKTLFIADAAGMVRLYNVQTWKPGGTVTGISDVSRMYPDRHPAAEGFVLVVRGQLRDTITLIDGRTGAFMAALRYPNVTEITDVAHLEIGTFVASAGPLKDGTPTGNGLVTAMVPGDVTVMAQTAVGVNPLQVLIDRASFHAFVLSYDRFDAPGGWNSRLVVSTFALVDGKLLRETPVAIPAGSAVPGFALDSASGHLYLTGQGLTSSTKASPNQLIALDTKSGKVMHAVKLSARPSA